MKTFFGRVINNVYCDLSHRKLFSIIFVIRFNYEQIPL